MDKMESRQNNSKNVFCLHNILASTGYVWFVLVFLCDANVPEDADTSQARSTTSAHQQLPLVISKTSAYDVEYPGQQVLPSADTSGIESPLKDVGNHESYQENDVKPTKDDWYYDPDGDDNGEVWNEKEDKNSKPYDQDPIVSHSSDGVIKGIEDSVNEDNDAAEEDDTDDDDDDNYDFWAKFPDNNKHENNDEEVQEPNQAVEQDEDVDEKLLEDVADDVLAKKNKPPTAPSKMVLFYTWMILAILVMVIGVSTYQARCRGLHSNTFRLQTREDRKRLVDHEYT